MSTFSVAKNTKTTATFRSIPHSHKFYELYILADGKRNILIESVNYQLEAGDLLLIPQELAHGTEGGAYTRYLLVFTEEDLDDAQRETVSFLLNQKISMTTEEKRRVLEILEIMLKLENNHTKVRRKINERNLQICFSYLFFILSELKNFPSSKYSSTEFSSFSPLTRKIINYINDNYREPVNLEELSKEYFISKSHLCHKFKKETKMTVIDYLLQIRLLNAKKMLQYSNKSVGEISHACGFSSPNYFSLIFTKHTQLSPREYRKIYQLHDTATPPPSREIDNSTARPYE